LRKIGHKVSDVQIENTRKLARKQTEISAKRRQSKKVEFDPYPDSDEHFYFIAGYTEGDFAYGITWEQAEADGLLIED
jgi:hypothetical protein